MESDQEVEALRQLLESMALAVKDICEGAELIIFSDDT